MTEQFFAFKAYNTETLYGYGTAADAEEYAAALNRNREINCFGVYPLTEAEALEDNLEDRTDVEDLAQANWARGEDDSEQLVYSLDFEDHGYDRNASLLIQPTRGRYVVELALTSGEERVVAWEPTEPDRQEQAIEFARSNPIGCVLDAIAIDRNRRGL
jgi:hypothetical protein